MNEPRDLVPRAWLFDLDGTLVESGTAVERAWAYVAEKYQLDLAAIRRVHSGRTTSSTLELVAADLPAATRAAIIADQLGRQYQDLAEITPIDGAAELVGALDAGGHSWAVVTSADRRLATARLAAVGLAPPFVVTSDDVRTGKPDPEGYLMAAARLGVPPRGCLAIEDATAGVEAARRAGMRVAGVRGVAADLSVAHLADLRRLLPTGPS